MLCGYIVFSLFPQFHLLICWSVFLIHPALWCWTYIFIFCPSTRMTQHPHPTLTLFVPLSFPPTLHLSSPLILPLLGAHYLIYWLYFKNLSIFFLIQPLFFISYFNYFHYVTLLVSWYPHFPNSLTFTDLICCCTVAKPCPTLCDPMDCNIPGFPVLHHLLDFAQIHVNWVSDAIKLSHPLSSPFPPVFNLFQNQDLSQWAGSLYWVAKVLDHQSCQWILRADVL